MEYICIDYPAFYSEIKKQITAYDQRSNPLNPYLSGTVEIKANGKTYLPEKYGDYRIDTTDSAELYAILNDPSVLAPITSFTPNLSNIRA